MNDQTTKNPSPQPEPAAKYFMAVGVLMVIIIMLLAVIWMKERTARIQAQREALRSYRSMEGDIAEITGRIARASAEPLHRDDLPVRDVMLDGAPRKLLLVGPAAGQRMGLQSGDMVLIVEEDPSTRPSQTRPVR